MNHMQKKYHTQTKMSKDRSRNANEEAARQIAACLMPAQLLMTIQTAEQDKSK
jgi:hypothetical protein